MYVTMSYMKEGIIKNIDEIATTKLRKDALDILEEGYRAINTEKVITSNIRVEDGHLFIEERDINLNDYERVFFVGIGKCSADAAIILESILGDYLTSGIVVDVRGVVLQKIQSKVGTHPLPSEANIKATRSIKELLEDATERDLILTVISGGGSALLCLPHDIQCKLLIEITKTLMKKGATIEELNTVRKHLSLIQGGQFAKLAYPAKVVSLIFSDVPGDDIGTISSGPTVLDKTTKEDAEKILVKYDVLNVCKQPNCEVFETPKEEKYFAGVDNILLLTNKTALSAMKEKAEDLGYRAIIADSKVEGEARIIGKLVAQQAKNNTCLLYGGETTVTVEKEGKGGRCQEFILGALPYIKENSVIVAVASDGWDNTDVAGALGDNGILGEADRKGFDVNRFLKDNKSYDFFKLVNGHIKTGRIGSNVSDLYFTLTLQ